MRDTTEPVDRRLQSMRSELLLCSACLLRGEKRPIPQLISHRHTPRSLCTACWCKRRSAARDSCNKTVTLP
jgi:hypothetical protein